MKQNIAFAAVLALCACLGGTASATTITGNFSINGVDSFTSTSVTFSGLANVGADTGNFGSLAPCTGCVTMNVGTLSAGVLPALIYTAVSGAVTSTFTLNPPASFTFSTIGGIDQLVIAGSGIVTLSGFDPTPAVWSLTAQGLTGTNNGFFTFSASLISVPQVPLPASLPLFASGLVGLYGLARKRKKQQAQPTFA